jgi:H+/Cl- antiporter ClcA
MDMKKLGMIILIAVTVAVVVSVILKLAGFDQTVTLAGGAAGGVVGAFLASKRKGETTA